LNEELTVK